MENEFDVPKLRQIAIYIDKETAQFKYVMLPVYDSGDAFLRECVRDTNMIPIGIFARADKDFTPKHTLRTVTDDELLNMEYDDQMKAVNYMKEREEILNEKLEALAIALDAIFSEVEDLESEFPDKPVFNRSFVEIYQINHRY